MFNFSVEGALRFFMILTFILPLASLLVILFCELLGKPLNESAMYRLIEKSLGTNFLISPLLLILFTINGLHSFEVSLGTLMTVGHYNFTLSIVADKLNLPLVIVANFLVGIVGRFSMRYLHREAGFRRFFSLLLIFNLGLLMVLMAGTIDLLFAGWELVGLSSVLLISFFQYRQWPVKNAFYTFVSYKICDVALLAAAIEMHNFTHTASFTAAFHSVEWPHGHLTMNWEPSLVLGVLIVIASMGKAAQLPFTSWLPKAMEGPTPSSAIFYGALSSHLGPFLLLRMYPLFATNLTIKCLIVLVGSLTVLYASGVGRTKADIKSSLSYATVTQISLVYIEIGLGLPFVALIHLVGHACLRTLQFLRSPSVINDFHQMHNIEGTHFHAPGAYFELVLPEKWRRTLYYHAVREFYLDVILERFLFRPFLAPVKLLSTLESKFISLITGEKRK